MTACDKVFWKDASPDSFILRTIGVQAVFDVLRKIVGDAYEARDISEDYFCNRISNAGDIDFSDERFRNPSGSGRTLIRRTLEEAIGLNA